MHRMNCVLMSLLLMITDERLRVSGSSRSISASVGEDVTLNCSVDSNITHEDLKVSWKKTDKDGDIVVLLYQNNEASPEASIERYRDRVEFFTDEIHKGNFSLRLKSVRTEDKGVYMCEVSAGGLSANTTVELERLFKCSHHTLQPATMEHLKVEWRRTDSDFLVHLYVDGKSGADEQHQDYRDRAHFITEEIQHGNLSLRLDNLRTEDEGRYTCTVYRQKKYVFSVKKNVEMWLLDTFHCLQLCLVFFPNVLMFLAFVFWGVSEAFVSGSLLETVSCCSLYFLRPLMLLWTAPYVNDFTGNIKAWIKNYSYEAEYVFFSAVFYSVLFKSAWDKSLNYAGFEGTIIIVLFVTVILFSLFYFIFCVGPPGPTKGDELYKRPSSQRGEHFHVLPRRPWNEINLSVAA
ncbi:uncharacterized protein LOC127159865 [Labeo rohita]|uniref:uncharacterized protein LOC127159865 n=1 Tax=Labeo rohita TaxID=84645 RepID=UPI0021E32FB3|nr:uncharacterized protein LOC127159865 [Labeo rohita]